MHLALLETASLPRARSRALSKGALCRGPAPGALGKQTALGKLAPDKYGRMGHGGHWRQSLPSARRQALGKDFF